MLFSKRGNLRLPSDVVDVTRQAGVGVVQADDVEGPI